MSLVDLASRQFQINAQWRLPSDGFLCFGVFADSWRILCLRSSVDSIDHAWRWLCFVSGHNVWRDLQSRWWRKWGSFFQLKRPFYLTAFFDASFICNQLSETTTFHPSSDQCPCGGSLEIWFPGLPLSLAIHWIYFLFWDSSLWLKINSISWVWPRRVLHWVLMQAKVEVEKGNSDQRWSISLRWIFKRKRRDGLICCQIDTEMDTTSECITQCRELTRVNKAAPAKQADSEQQRLVNPVLQHIYGSTSLTCILYFCISRHFHHERHFRALWRPTSFEQSSQCPPPQRTLRHHSGWDRSTNAGPTICKMLNYAFVDTFRRSTPSCQMYL